MSLLLCRQRAESPFCHDKLNIGLRSEQELCYVIYNYPLLCLDDFFTERLYSWIETQLGRRELAERLRINERAGESVENRFIFILQSCNYYDVNEIMDFSKRIAEYKKLSGSELIALEGSALFKAGNFTDAYEKYEQAIKELEQEYRKNGQQDDSRLRELNTKKASLYCDMAAVKLQMFDERMAIELLDMSLMTFDNDRAKRMRYLIDGCGELSEETYAELDAKKEAVKNKARESKAYKEVLDIFEMDKEDMFKAARKLAGSWKKACRKM